MSLSVGVLPDVHMRNEYREAVGDRLEATVDELASFGPDLVVVLGDVIEHEATPEEDVRNVEAVQRVLEFDCPVRYLGGNHDTYNLDNDRLAEVFGNDLWGVERYGGEKLVFLNTSSPWLSGARGEVTDGQLEMLREEVRKDEPFTIFVHHPIHYHDVQNTYWWTNYPERAFCANKKEINAVLDPETVKGVFNGHLHENHLARYGGIEHVTINAFSKETREKPVTGTYAEVEIGETVAADVKVDGELVRGYEF